MLVTEPFTFTGTASYTYIYKPHQSPPAPPRVFEPNPSRTVTPSSMSQPQSQSSSPSTIDVLRIACMLDLFVLPQVVVATVSTSPHARAPSPVVL